MSTNTRSTDTKLSILIAGAGFGGLMLGTLLEKVNISYCIYERTAIANFLDALPTNTILEIEKAFSEYKTERSAPAIEVYHSSKALANYSEGGILGAFALYILGHLPGFLLNYMTKRHLLHRPQVGFLKEVSLKDPVAAAVSPSTEKTRKVYEATVGSVSL
ncbi:MAG: hypothetical protein J3R72DRAFT_525599 [Linnemannia gamsii]|nr:MAG: hypothetical protein J3R72DRAFT_525599 [Linnemannia gamsii]